MENLTMEQLISMQQKTVSTFNVYGQIDDKLALSFREFANEILSQEPTPTTPIILYINTPGGSVASGSAIMSTIEELQDCNIKVYAHIEGHCCSMGVPIAIACDRRSANKFTTFMIHGASVGMRDYISKSLKYLEFERKQSTKIDEFMVQRTELTMDILQEYASDELWLDYTEALEYKIVTEDIYAEPEPDEIEIATNKIKSLPKATILSCLQEELDDVQTLLMNCNPEGADAIEETLHKVLSDRYEATQAVYDIVYEMSNVTELDDNYCMFIFNTIERRL